MEGCLPHPVRQRRTIEFNALAGVNLRLPVERQVIGIFGDQDLGDGGLGRQSALDQPGRRRRLHDAVLASPAGVFGTPGHEDPELRRDQVQPLASILSNPVQLALAAGTGLVLDVDDDLDPRQVRRQGTTVAAALASPHLTAFGCAHVLRRLAIRCDLLDVFQTQQHLIFRQRLCPPAKPMSLQFLDDLTQPFALAPLGEQHRFQRLGIVRQGVVHTQFRAYSPPSGDAADAPDSLRRSAANSYPACVGVDVSRASCTSRQSRPSSSADNCAADRRITPSSILGQRKIPSSSRLANRHRPVPSQNTSLIRSARLARNT